jgi:hypothetical protein
MPQFRRACLAILAVWALAGGQTGGAHAQKPLANARCAAITPKQVAALFDRWNASLATNKPDTVVKNYATDAVLLPTKENGPLIGPHAIRGYFSSRSTHRARSLSARSALAATWYSMPAPTPSRLTATIRAAGCSYRHATPTSTSRVADNG